MELLMGGVILFFQWKGRVDGDEQKERIHQVVQNIHINDISKKEKQQIGIVGFECDEGVRRNQGRVGAAKAPNVIRRFLADFAFHDGEVNIIDVGNIQCLDNELEKAQDKLGEYVSKLIQSNYTPIILGGGHETFYGHYLGAREAVGKDKTIGLINLDAHLDIRDDGQPSSGTMFRQILEQDVNADYLCIGLQEMGNTKQLFSTAEKYGVNYIMETEIEPFENTFAKIDEFAKQHDYIVYTICTDVINQAYAPGVSAPAPLGIEPKTVRLITERVVRQTNLLSFDVSEVNPTFDVNDKTARLISSVIAETVLNLNRKS